MNKSFSQRGAALGGAVATLTASIALGAAGSVAVYRVVAGPSATTPALAVPNAQEAQETPLVPAARVKPKVKWAPCKPPAVLEKGVCVTDVVKTVVLPAAAAAPAAARPAAPAVERVRAESRNEGRRDDGRGDDRDDDRDDRDDRDDDREDREDHEDEDHEDEDREDEDREDDDHEDDD